MADFGALCGIAFGFADFVKTGTAEEIAEITAIAARVNGGGPISPLTVRRLKMLEGHYHLLVAAEMWCPDCRVNLPAMDLLCRQQPNVRLSIMTQTRAERAMMAALGLSEILVPTVAILDHEHKLIGRFVEQPRFVTEGDREALRPGYLNGNYTDSTITDLLDVMEAAAAAAHPLPRNEG